MSVVEESMPETLEVLSRAEKYLVFELSDELYAIPVLLTKSIVQMQPITPVPKVPKFIRGVTNLRGKVVPIIDLRERLGMGETPKTPRTCIVVTEIEIPEKGMSLVGVITDGVEEVRDISQASIDEKVSLGNHIDERYIAGITRIKARAVTLLKIAELILDNAQGLEKAEAK